MKKYLIAFLLLSPAIASAVCNPFVPNTVLKATDLNNALSSPCILSGSIDGSVIGFNNSKAGYFTTLNAASSIIGNETASSVAASSVIIGGINLSSSNGASAIGFIQSGASAVAATIQSKERQIVNASDYGAACNGVTNDASAFSAAAISFGGLGGTVNFQGKCLISSNLTVPVNVTIKGPFAFVGTPGNTTNYGNMSALLVASGVTVTLSGGAGIEDTLMYRSDMTFPAADASLFAGTAVTIGGDDAFVMRSMILGFNQAVLSVGHQRPRIEYLYHDNSNGISIQTSYDIAYVNNNHAWPFATIGAGAVNVKDRRSGTAYEFLSVGDWGKATNNFSYGYWRGFHLGSVNSMTLLSDGTDGDQAHPWSGQIGFLIDGASNDTRLIGAQSTLDTGIFVNTSAGTHTAIIDANTWSCATRGILVNGGDAEIIGGTNRNTINGIFINNASSVVAIDGVNFSGNSNSEILFNSANTTTYLGSTNVFSSFLPGSSPIGTAANYTAPQVASSSAVSLPNTGATFIVTGTTNFGTLLTGWQGRTVKLIFSSSLTVLNSTGSANAMSLSGGYNFTVPAGGTLTLTHNGTQWYETGRSGNTIDTTTETIHVIDGATSSLTISNASGVSGNGAGVKIIGNGATTPNKYIRVAGGTFQILNSAYGAVILNLSDAGALGSLTSVSAGSFTATTGVITPLSASGVVGTTTNDNAQAGSWGEYASSSVVSTAINLSTASSVSVTNLPLTAGDYDCTGICTFQTAASTVVTGTVCGIATTNGTFGADGTYARDTFASVTPGAVEWADKLSPVTRLSLASSATAYLNVQSTFTTSTQTAGGFMRCRRIR